MLCALLCLGSVDLTCHSVEQMTYLVKGFTALISESKKKRQQQHSS